MQYFKGILIEVNCIHTRKMQKVQCTCTQLPANIHCAYLNTSFIRTHSQEADKIVMLIATGTIVLLEHMDCQLFSQNMTKASCLQIFFYNISIIPGLYMQELSIRVYLVRGESSTHTCRKPVIIQLYLLSQ